MAVRNCNSSRSRSSIRARAKAGAAPSNGSASSCNKPTDFYWRKHVRRWIRFAGAEEEQAGLSAHGAQGGQGLARARCARLRGKRGRRREAGQAHVVPTERQAEVRRGGLVFLDRLQEPQASRWRARQSDEGPAHHQHDGPQVDAFRRKAHVLRRVQRHDQPLRRRSKSAKNNEPFVINRVFDAPRERGWEAWAEGEKLKQWWGPAGVKGPTRKVDPR